MGRTGYVVAAILAVALMVGAASADDVTSALAAAGTAYGNGDYKETSTQLQVALAAVNQMLIDALIAVLPEPPAGWTAEEPEGIDAASLGAGFFATLVVERTYYTPGGSPINMTISANSPMLMSLRMFLSNPMMAAAAGQQGMKSTQICGFDAIEHFGDGTYEAHVLGGNATLISFDGSTEDDVPHIQTLAGATDCQAIVDIVE
jgi:hypothetical protein